MPGRFALSMDFKMLENASSYSGGGGGGGEEKEEFQSY